MRAHEPNLAKLVAMGESTTLELKRSTGELREAQQTLCAFANGRGGSVVIGVRPNGEIVGQQVSEQTFHEIAAARERFEPPIEIDIESVEVAAGRSAIVLSVASASHYSIAGGAVSLAIFDDRNADSRNTASQRRGVHMGPETA